MTPLCSPYQRRLRDCVDRGTAGCLRRTSNPTSESLSRVITRSSVTHKYSRALTTNLPLIGLIGLIRQSTLPCTHTRGKNPTKQNSATSGRAWKFSPRAARRRLPPPITVKRTATSVGGGLLSGNLLTAIKPRVPRRTPIYNRCARYVLTSPSHPRGGFVDAHKLRPPQQGTRDAQELPLACAEDGDGHRHHEERGGRQRATHVRIALMQPWIEPH